MRSKRMLVYGLSIVVVLALLLVIFRRHRADRQEGSDAAQTATPVPDIAVSPATVGAIRQELTVAGIFQPFQEIDVHGKVSGYIRHIYVDIGDRVRKGQTLAVLEVPELNAQVAGAQAGVSSSQDQIARLKNDVTEAQANYSATHANYVRLKAASDQQPGLIAAQELDNARASDATAAARVDAAQAAVSAAQGQLGVARADQLRVSSLAQYADITAPYNGVVTMRYADTGALIPAGTAEGLNQAVVRLAQSDLLRLRMPVPEADVPMIHVGSPVMVHVQATGQQFPGSVIRYTRDVSNATRTMLAEVDVENPDLTLTPGMYADVTFALRQKTNALIVPAAAIIQGDQPSVMVVNANNEVERVPVDLGISSANLQEVAGGLQPGARVIVGDLSTLQPGERVHPSVAPSSLLEYHRAGAQGTKGGQ